MKLFAVVTGALAVFALPALTEVVQIMDGRSVDLKDDGTYVFVEADAPRGDAYVTFEDSYFKHHTSEYDQKSVRFMPIYKNNGDKKITGIKFQAQFLNSFGEEIVAFTGNSDEQISPGKSSSYNIFYVFEDNPFINGETYDKLLPMVTNASGSIKVSATMIALEGGEIVNLTQQ